MKRISKMDWMLISICIVCILSFFVIRGALLLQEETTKRTELERKGSAELKLAKLLLAKKEYLQFTYALVDIDRNFSNTPSGFKARHYQENILDCIPIEDRETFCNNLLKSLEIVFNPIGKEHLKINFIRKHGIILSAFQRKYNSHTEIGSRVYRLLKMTY